MKKSVPDQNQEDVGRPLEDLEKLKTEAEQWKGKYLRALADYQNFQRRVNAEKEEREGNAAGKIIVSLLDSLDTLEKAEIHLQDKGLSLGMDGFREALTKQGLLKIEALHKKFNPMEMECVEAVVSDKENDVVEEARAGYKLKDSILRVAQVKVGKKEIDQKAKIKNDVII